MKLLKLNLIQIIGLPPLLLAVSCSIYSVITSDYDRNTDFTQYKTYAWLPDKDNANSAYNNSIIRNNIKNYFTHELVDNYGFTVNTDKPDILMEIVVTKINRTKSEEHPINTAVPNRPNYNTYGYNNNPYQQNPYSNNPYYTPQPNPYNYNNYNSGYRYQTQYVKEQHNYTESNIKINMIDLKRNELVWTATAIADIYDENTYNISDNIHPAVHKILKYFPIKPIKKQYK